MSELPANCILDKGKVGCGGTSIAIESNTPYVIAVPHVDIIKNKVDQYPNDRYSGEVFGVMGGVDETELIAYLERVDIPKIIVTYDSLEKLTQWIDPSEYKILIDEYHILTTCYSYRRKAVQTILANYEKYKESCFMTATVLDDEFLLDELKDIDKLVMNWEEKTKVTIETVKCKNNVIYAVAYLIDLFLTDIIKGNAYFFVNSVKFINIMVKMCGLDETNTRVIYSDNNETNVGIKRGKPSDEPKKINFITSTAFEGVDFFDE